METDNKQNTVFLIIGGFFVASVSLSVAILMGVSIWEIYTLT
ncbi:hypothetical protein [Flavobacterium sp. 83]|jgi:hypothetical protein|nr:hypothetical protein [Flavobacterium sp. 83]